MLGIWLEDNQLSLRSDIPIPKPPPGEALVKVSLAGICSTDLELVKGYYPYKGILGHEFVGRIVEAPGATNRIGQRVVGEINAVCGRCTRCLSGCSTHCESRTVLGIVNRDGAFAEYLVLPLENLIEVPSELPDVMAVFTEPIAAALEIQEQLKIRPTDRVLLIGAGRLGQLIAQTLTIIGCDLSVVVRRAKQRSLLKARGITCLSEKQIRLESFDIVIEATGSSDGIKMAIEAVRPRGTIVMKSTYADTACVDISKIVVNEISLLGSRCGPFKPALRLMCSQQINPIGLIEEKYLLKDGLKAFDFAGQPGIFKVLIEIPDDQT